MSENIITARAAPKDRPNDYLLTIPAPIDHKLLDPNPTILTPNSQLPTPNSQRDISN